MKQTLTKFLPLVLATALQTMPFLRTVLPVVSTGSAPSSWAFILKVVLGTAALSSVDAVSGASSITVSPANATNGQPYSGIVQYSGQHASDAKSWQLRTNWNGNFTACGNVYQIAPGLWLTNVASHIARIGGTPTSTGAYGFQLRIWSGTSCSGGDNDTRASKLTLYAGSAPTKPVITNQPISLTVTNGGTAQFSVGATGVGLAYIWRTNGGILNGQNNNSLVLANVTPANAADYTVIVTNAGGAVTSQVAKLTVLLPPAVTAHPTNRIALAGSNTTFLVTATGTSPSYFWRFNSSPIGGGTAASLVLTSLTTNQSGIYSCLISNAAGTAVSSNAQLLVVAPVGAGIAPKLGNASAAPGQFSFFFPVLAGYRYLLQRSDSLTSTNWTTITSLPPTFASYPFAFTDTATNGLRFYRARMQTD